MKRYHILSLYLGFSTAFLNGSLAASRGRAIFINGIDASSMLSQEMKDVDVKIDEKGNIHIVAPQYQIKEEDTFVPLSQVKAEAKTPMPPAPLQHKEPAAVPAAAPPAPSSQN